MKVLDTNRNTTAHLSALKSAGYDTIIRYIAYGLEHEEKVVKPAEARAIAAAGLKLGLVYEIGGKPSGVLVGQRDGQYALRYAAVVGAPAGAIIWYTVDFDAGPAEMPGIVAAFRAFKNGLAGQYRVGAYASGWVCDQLYEQGLCSARWLTDSGGFRGTKASRSVGRYELMQALPATIAGLDADPDAVHMDAEGNAADIGDFVPFMPAGTAVDDAGSDAPPTDQPPVDPAPRPEPSPAPTPEPHPVPDQPPTDPQDGGR